MGMGVMSEGGRGWERGREIGNMNGGWRDREN